MTTKHLLALLDKLGNPQNNLNIIHVAGTNGKGSVCSMIEGVFMKIPGFKVARFSSPTPVDDKNGITINGKRISEADYQSCQRQVQERSLEMAAQGLEVPSPFEYLVALSILYFTKYQVDVTIMEVGMGGLHDATNVFDKPLLSIITGIDYDHTDFLGNTLTDITTHKAGIIKNNCPVLVGDLPKEAMQVIFKQSAKMKARLIHPYRYPIQYQRNLIEIEPKPKDLELFHPYEQVVIFHDDATTYHLSLMGLHQVTNLKIAVSALNELISNFPTLSRYIHSTGQIIWPCRQEIFYHQNKQLMFDGAHNPQSMSALVDTISNDFKSHSVAVLFSVFSDKDIASMIKKLSTISGKLIITYMNHERGAKTDQMLKVAKKYFDKIIVITSPDKAFEVLMQQSEDILLTTGSLYLTVPLRNRITPVVSSVY